VLRDDQGQPTVGVDAAKYLVEVERVPAFTGRFVRHHRPIISSVTAPSKVVQITCCSTASPFTLDGRSAGYFFRTIPTSKTQAYATASETTKRGMKKTAVIYVNTDFGTDMLRFYKAALAKLGGEIAVEVPYNDNQPSYRAEVSKALAAKPESLLLIGFPRTRSRSFASGFRSTARARSRSTTRCARWISSTASARSSSRISSAWTTPRWPAARRFVQQVVRGEVQGRQQGAGRAHAIRRADGHGARDEHRQGPDGPSIKDAVRLVHVPNGAPVGTGPGEFKKALELIKAGKPIKYFGATGPIEFDANGDVTGRRWSGRSKTARS
jgi:branched-chain amino acid transport system substrate-binding protein